MTKILITTPHDICLFTTYFHLMNSVYIHSLFQNSNTSRFTREINVLWKLQLRLSENWKFRLRSFWFSGWFVYEYNTRIIVIYFSFSKSECPDALLNSYLPLFFLLNKKFSSWSEIAQNTVGRWRKLSNYLQNSKFSTYSYFVYKNFSNWFLENELKEGHDLLFVFC